MKRTVRPSRFQLGDASEEPRPSYRKLCFVNPFQLEAPSALPCASSMPVSICNPSQRFEYGGRTASVHKRPPIVLCAGTVESSARSLEDTARLKWAQAWVACARVVAAHSASLCDISSDSAFLPLFLDRSPSTLQRHLSGWQVWTSYCVLDCSGAFNGTRIRFPGRLAGWLHTRQKEGAEEKCCSRSARDVFCCLQVVPSSVVLVAGVSFDTSLERFRQMEHGGRARSNPPAFGPCSQAGACILGS